MNGGNGQRGDNEGGQGKKRRSFDLVMHARERFLLSRDKGE